MPKVVSKLVAERDYNAGVIIYTLRPAEMTDYRTRESIEVSDIEGNTLHLFDPMFQYCNHSFDPNIIINKNTWDVQALRDIKRGEELCFDYTKHEREISHPFIDQATGRPVGLVIRDVHVQQINSVDEG